MKEEFIPINIMAAFAHKDDESGAAGTLSKLAQKGHKVYLVAATLGELGSRRRSTRKVIAARQREFEKSAELLGAYPISLDHLEGDFDIQKVQRDLTGVARDINVDVVITHHHDDYHHLHRQVSEAAKVAVFNIPATPYRARARRLLVSGNNDEFPAGIRRTRLKRIVPPPLLNDVAFYEMDPQGLKKRDSLDEGYSRDNIADVGLIVGLEPDEAKMRTMVYEVYHSQESLRDAWKSPYTEQLARESQIRGGQAGFDFGEGFTQIAWGGETFSIFNRLQDMLPGEVYDVRSRKILS